MRAGAPPTAASKSSPSKLDRAGDTLQRRRQQPHHAVAITDFPEHGASSVGTAVFVVATAIALPCYRWMEGRWPIMPMVGGFFVLVFGGLTLWLQDETFIKLKPTIVNCLFGVILGGGLLC